MTHVQKDTAFLLKEKGFDLPCEVYYTTDCYGKEFGKHIDYNKLPTRSGVLCSCPDIYTACIWLRAKGVHVYVKPQWSTQEWFGVISIFAKTQYTSNYPTHDLALEAGIVHALKNYVK
jgi:hypothetical protein